MQERPRGSLRLIGQRLAGGVRLLDACVDPTTVQTGLAADIRHTSRRARRSGTHRARRRPRQRKQARLAGSSSRHTSGRGRQTAVSQKSPSPQADAKSSRQLSPLPSSLGEQTPSLHCSSDRQSTFARHAPPTSVSDVKLAFSEVARSRSDGSKTTKSRSPSRTSSPRRRRRFHAQAHSVEGSHARRIESDTLGERARREVVSTGLWRDHLEHEVLRWAGRAGRACRVGAAGGVHEESHPPCAGELAHALIKQEYRLEAARVACHLATPDAIAEETGPATAQHPLRVAQLRLASDRGLTNGQLDLTLR